MAHYVQQINPNEGSQHGADRGDGLSSRPRKASIATQHDAIQCPHYTNGNRAGSHMAHSRLSGRSYQLFSAQLTDTARFYRADSSPAASLVTIGINKGKTIARRRWIADRTEGNRAWLIGANATHLARVLRAAPGQQFEIATPEGVHTGTILQVTDEEVSFTLGNAITTAEQTQTSLLLAVFKFDRFEWAIEKATELGATEILPTIARRTEKHLAAAAGKRVERWRRLAHEAAQQSRQAAAPTIHDPLPLKAALERCVGLSGPHILLAETEREHTLWNALTTSPNTAVTFAIGPEGGWADDEFKLFSDRGWIFATLGDSILRAETATIAALSVVNQARLVNQR